MDNEEQFKYDYIHTNIPVKVLQKKYHIGSGKIKRIYKEMRKDGIKMRENYKHGRSSFKLDQITDDTYITLSPNNKYYIQKSINGSAKNFGTYKTKIDAINVRNLLIKYNWDKSMLNKIKQQCGVI